MELFDTLPPHYHPAFLNSHHFIPVRQPLSVVVPTYNRCPYSPLSIERNKNPLKWCVESLLQQEAVTVRQIVIIDDGSNDYTTEVVSSLRSLCESFGVDLTYHKNAANIGSPHSKNIGIEAATQKMVLFADDDCVFTPYAAFGALLSYIKLNADVPVGAVHLPVYVRATKPVQAVKKAEFGRIDLATGKVTSTSRAFPYEYLHSPEFLDETLGILMPISVQNLSGIFVAEKKNLLRVGGYPTYFTWRNGLTEEAELALRLQDAGLHLYHQADPKFQVIHLRYGGENVSERCSRTGRDSTILPNVNISLEEMVAESIVPRLHSGNRVNVREYAHARLVSHIVLLGIRNLAAAGAWANRAFTSFVLQNDPQFTRGFGAAMTQRERRKLWRTALDEGMALCQTLTSQKTIPLEKII